MATAKRLSPIGPSDPESGIRVLSHSANTQKKENVPIEVKPLKKEQSGQDILLSHMFRRAPALGFGRRHTKSSKKGRKARKTAKHRR